MTKVEDIINRLYPLEDRRPAQIKLAFLFGMVVFLLMYFLQPFGKTPDGQAVLMNSSYAGLLTFLSILFVYFVLYPLFPLFFKEAKWTIGREVVLTLIIIVTIASANIMAGRFFWNIPLSITNWLRTIFYTAIVGIAPATLSILLNQARLLKKYRKEVGQINHNLHSVSPDILIKFSDLQEKIELDGGMAVSNNILTIEAENEKDNLVIPIDSFLAASSADNYVKVFYWQLDHLKTSIIRTTLKKLEENTKPFPILFRCHRTAIVNMAAVQNLTGSAQGYRLNILHLPDAIPVSRNLNHVIKEKLASIHP